MTESRVSKVMLQSNFFFTLKAIAICLCLGILKKKLKTNNFQHNSLVRLMPSYRLEPKNPFNTEKCENILKTVLESAFDEFEYSAEAAEAMVQKLSQTILTQVRKLNFDRLLSFELFTIAFKSLVTTIIIQFLCCGFCFLFPRFDFIKCNLFILFSFSLSHVRYKLICIVSIVQTSMPTIPGLCESYRCLWDKKLDKIAAHVYETPNLLAIATVYGLYFDWNSNYTFFILIVRHIFFSSFEMYFCYYSLW